MKSIALACGLSVLLLVGCTDRPNTTIPAQESQATNALTLTKGLEDCKLYWFTPSEHSSSISIVRCPNSQVSASTEYTQNKTTRVKTTVTIDGVEYIKAPPKKDEIQDILEQKP